MSCIHGKDTKPEEIVRKYLFSKGFRYRKNDKKLPGSPDVVLPKYRTVIFVNGCFWHGHDGCRYFIWPKNNAEFWHHKIETNIERDARKKKQLEDAGWNVIVVWECQLRPEKRDKTLEELESILKARIGNASQKRQLIRRTVIMPRPKGSKNKVKTPVVIIDYAAELEKKISEKNTLEADITALEADVDGLKVQLKEKKTALKALDKDIAALEQKKSRQDAEALRKAQKEEIDKAIQQLLDDGMSMEEVLNKLKR